MTQQAESVPYSNPTTSRDAARAMRSRAGLLRETVLSMIRDSGNTGCTAFEAYGAMASNNQTISPRFTELHQRGRIVDSGRRRDNPASGRAAIVYVVADGDIEAPRKHLATTAAKLDALREAVARYFDAKAALLAAGDHYLPDAMDKLQDATERLQALANYEPKKP